LSSDASDSVTSVCKKRSSDLLAIRGFLYSSGVRTEDEARAAKVTAVTIILPLCEAQQPLNTAADAPIGTKVAALCCVTLLS
jgi:hypothetical protein